MYPKETRRDDLDWIYLTRRLLASDGDSCDVALMTRRHSLLMCWSSVQPAPSSCRKRWKIFCVKIVEISVTLLGPPMQLKRMLPPLAYRQINWLARQHFSSWKRISSDTEYLAAVAGCFLLFWTSDLVLRA